MPGTLPRQRSGIGDSCQSGKKATLLNASVFLFEMSFLTTVSNSMIMPYVVKRSSGVSCNWCVLLDIALILVLTIDTTIAKNSHVCSP